MKEDEPLVAPPVVAPEFHYEPATQTSPFLDPKVNGLQLRFSLWLSPFCVFGILLFMGFSDPMGNVLVAVLLGLVIAFMLGVFASSIYLLWRRQSR